MATPLPDSDHRITLNDAVRITTARRQADAGAGELPFAFHRNGLDRLLGQAQCVGIRAYPAQQDDGTHVWVLVGVDSAGNDMANGELAEEPFLCPPVCADANPLNGG